MPWWTLIPVAAERLGDQLARGAVGGPPEHRAGVPPNQAWDPGVAVPDEVLDERIPFYCDLLAQDMADWPAQIREPLIDSSFSCWAIKAS